ncbi:MAG: hypothetical protein NW220_02960 [Leptolyngbyaceae cyanobacterium bins.349]|nr:hypothetical protein [Leptolyngbyaceae cyanobacterium bins.349]
MRKRIREKICDRCAAGSPVMYRVQHDDSGTWRFVCPDCWAIVSQDNPFYIYGGTWKARKA